MKLKLSCGKCLSDFMDGKIPAPDQQFVYINDENVYKFTCVNKHDNIYVLNNLKSSIIYDSGLNALHDHYLREAVTSFYAALENFYTECIYYFYKISGKEITEDNYDNAVKKGMKLSERKLGAFYALYLLIMDDIAPTFPDKFVNIRNTVLHGAHYPTYQETVGMGNAVRDYIYSIINNLNTKYPDSYIYMQSHWFKKIMTDIKGRENVRTANKSFYLTYYEIGSAPDIETHIPIAQHDGF